VTLPIYSFYLTVHDSNEYRLKVSGCRGAEYFNDSELLLKRLKEFERLDVGMSINLLFVNTDKKNGYYFPEKNQQEIWKELLSMLEFYSITFDIANKRSSNGGLLSVPEFYYERDHDLIGFRPATVHYIEEGVPYELEQGFDVTKTKSLYL